MKIKLSANRRHLVTAADTPFFFFADTAWNGPLKATEDEWDRYLETRAEQGFTAIQFVLTHWRGAAHPRHGRIYDEIDGEVVENPAALAKMDAYIQRVVDLDLVPVPVMFWTNNPEPFAQPEPWMQEVMSNPYFSESAMVDIGLRMVARWQQHAPLWLLGGDGDYRGREFADLWKRVGRNVFSDTPDALVTMHSCGSTWICDLFADEPWYNVATYQSGHGSSDNDLRMLTQGPFATRWSALEMPIINIEPNYEHALSFTTKRPFAPHEVRRASYWSLLSAAPAGITYGVTSIWAWLREAGEHAEGHGESWPGNAWTTGLQSEGIDSLIVLREIFAALPWTDLRPADHLLETQPGHARAEQTVKVAQTQDESLVVVYRPADTPVSLQLPRSVPHPQAEWINPRDGSRQSAQREPGDKFVFLAPDTQDWLLVLNPEVAASLD